MKKFIREISNNILSLNRYSKRTIVIVTDIALCVLCTWLAFILRLEELILFKDLNFYPVLISIIFVIPIFWLFGLYRTIFRYTGLSIIFSISVSIFVYTILYFLVIGVYSIQNVPRSIGIIQPILLFVTVITSRLSAKFFLINIFSLKKNYNKKKNVLIYGAGNSGRQLLIALENSPEFNVVGFLDDDTELHRQLLLGKKIFSLDNLDKLIRNSNVTLVFLALPSVSRSKRNQIIKNLNKFKLIVKTLPSILEIVDGRIKVSDIKDLNVDDLLNREQVEPNKNLLNKNIHLKTVLVTGAGGSIGSELCRQIVKLEPKNLLILEINEFALYKIYEELLAFNTNLKITPLLINIQDQSKLELIFDTFKVDTVYHAAAYKHVPLVEENICEGVKNNVFGTLAVVKATLNKKVSNFVLISSDKAVRPTNIMGASKRLAELCVQGIFEKAKDDENFNFSIVRFGNVLESSGSVIPKFKKQIKEGGPITLTHEDVTRYFMTVMEAAQLVIQAGSMGKYSEVFVLDMGEKIKIKDLIIKMINLSGFTVKDRKNIDGDIEIKIIGLRPGEKLYEELLIGDNPKKTNHPKIQKTSDPYIPYNQLESYLNILLDLINNNNAHKVKELLMKIVKSYKSNSEIVDHIHIEKSSLDNQKQNKSVLINNDNKVVKLK